MSKRRVRRKRRARVNIKLFILAGVISVAIGVGGNLKGADKEPSTEEIYITETPQAENAEPEPVMEQEAKLEHDLNYTYPYNTMSADWGSEVYEDGFRYYEIPQEYSFSYTPFFLLKGRYTMFKVGDAVKWMCSLDNEYTYGEITALKKSVATVKGTGLYSGITAEVHLRYIEKLMRGGGSIGSDCKKCSKRSTTKAEL